jgi:hypothetical protein
MWAIDNAFDFIRHGLKIFTSLKLRFQDFQRMKQSTSIFWLTKRLEVSYTSTFGIRIKPIVSAMVQLITDQEWFLSDQVVKQLHLIQAVPSFPPKERQAVI